MEAMDAGSAAACAEAQSEELLALRSIFEDDCQVDSEEPGEVSFSLRIRVELGLGDGGRARIRAQAPAGAASSSGLRGETDSTSGPSVSAPLTAEELAEEVIRSLDKGKAQPPWQLKLERSASGREQGGPEASVGHLPPLVLDVAMPADYPDAAPPQFQLTSQWLSSSQLAALCSELDTRAAEGAGMPIVFVWTEFLREETASILGLGDVIELSAVDSEVPDLRGVSDCVDPLGCLMELVRYDQATEMELWRQQVHACGICLSEKPGRQFVHLGGCLHTFCTECMSEMAKLHVTEGSLVELKCPQPNCRAEIGPSALEQVLDPKSYERWMRLKMQQVMTSELEGVVLCPRCEENGIDVPNVADQPASKEDLPVATCRRCHYIYCAKCRGVAHSNPEDCISEEERAAAAALRKAEGKTLTASERRQLDKGAVLEITPDMEPPKVDVMGFVTEDYEILQAGDEIVSVNAGWKGAATSVLYTKADKQTHLLEKALQSSPPYVIHFKSSRGGGMADRLRKKKALEELLTLRQIAADSQTCPRCRVRIMRSQGCNHMRCTHCDTHFCYRCGKTLSSSDPYSHFREGNSGCPTFDREEVQRLVVEQRRGVDDELEALRRQFGRQEDLFAQFDARERGMPVQRPRRREKDPNETRCPTCGQFNTRHNGLNHARCHHCRNSYCHHCLRRIQGVVANHFRGEGACPQHEARTEAAE